MLDLLGLILGEEIVVRLAGQETVTLRLVKWLPFEQVGGYLGRFGKIFTFVEVLGKRELGGRGRWCHGLIVSVELAHLVVVIVQIRPILQDSIG